MMTDSARLRLESLISDSSMFRAGQQDERLRICFLIDARIDTIRMLGDNPEMAARCQELLHMRQSLQDHP